jgi:hypothetical protein
VQKKLDSLASGVTNSSTVHLPAKKSKKTWQTINNQI